MPKFRVRKGARHYWKRSIIRGISDKVLLNKLMKEGDVIECERQELGSAIDKFVEVKDERKEVDEPVYGFTVEKVADGEYDVVSIKTGKRINDVTLDYNKAIKLSKKAGTVKDKKW